MQCYIVRIYRREPDDPEALVGIAEEVETRSSRPFTSFSELRTILNFPEKGAEGKAEKAEKS
jgi:hypothetical protein